MAQFIGENNRLSGVVTELNGDCQVKIGGRARSALPVSISSVGANLVAAAGRVRINPVTAPAPTSSTRGRGLIYLGDHLGAGAAARAQQLRDQRFEFGGVPDLAPGATAHRLARGGCRALDAFCINICGSTSPERGVDTSNSASIKAEKHGGSRETHLSLTVSGLAIAVAFSTVDVPRRPLPTDHHRRGAAPIRKQRKAYTAYAKKRASRSSKRSMTAARQAEGDEGSRQRHLGRDGRRFGTPSPAATKACWRSSTIRRSMPRTSSCPAPRSIARSAPSPIRRSSPSMPT